MDAEHHTYFPGADRICILPPIILLLVLVKETDVERLCELLTVIVPCRALDRPVIGHQMLDAVTCNRACKFLLFCFPADYTWKPKVVFQHCVIDVEYVLPFCHRFLFRSINAVAL